jgi:hypothetical protein
VNAAPVLDDELLDAYALLFARVALDRLMAEETPGSIPQGPSLPDEE